MLRDAGRQHKKMNLTVERIDAPYRQPYVPTAEFMGVRIDGYERKRLNFYRTAGNNDDGTIPGFIMWRRMRQDGICYKLNGFLYFRPNGELP